MSPNTAPATNTAPKQAVLPPLEITNKVKLDMPVQGKDYGIYYGHLKQSGLLFYAANPRIYSAIHKGDIEPTQALMEEYLCGKPHTNELKEDIRLNKGLIEPVLVKESTHEVVEGNSRLAAYRLLAKIDPIKWGWLRALILPADISDSGISSILSQLHLKGKLDWSPYEQAGHIHRRYRIDEVPLPDLSKEMKLSQGTLLSRIKVIDYMNKNYDNITDHWSHYDQLLKSKNIRKAFEQYPNLEAKIVSQVKNDTLKATDIRDKLDTICSTESKKPITMLLQGKPIDTVFEVAHTLGGDNDTLQLLTKFHESIAPSETKQAQDIAKSNAAIRKQIEYKLLGIRNILNKWIKSAKKGAPKVDKEDLELAEK